MNRLWQKLKSLAMPGTANRADLQFARFTSESQDIANSSVKVAQRYHHTTLYTEHVLLALLEQPDSEAAIILRDLNVDATDIRARLGHILQQIKPDPHVDTQLHVTPHVKKMIELAQQEADRLHSEFVKPEHLFLALLTTPDAGTAQLMSDYRLSWERANEVVERQKAMTE